MNVSHSNVEIENDLQGLWYPLSATNSLANLLVENSLVSNFQENTIGIRQANVPFN